MDIDSQFFGNEEEDDDDMMARRMVYFNPIPIQEPLIMNMEPVVPPLEEVGALVIKQPPEQWYQRGTGQEFSIEAWRPFSEYTLELMFAPDAGGTDYELVSKTRKVGNGLVHNPNNDIRDSETHLTVRPKIDICTRKGERLFVLQLTLSTGYVIRSRPFGVKNRQPKPNTFKSDAKRILQQLQWCSLNSTCHVCNQTFKQGHTTTCELRMLLSIPAGCTP
jgi:hypothetical protein